MKPSSKHMRTRIRLLLAVVMIGLVLSGFTAFPLETELRIFSSIVGVDPAAPSSNYTGFQQWIAIVAEGLRETYAKYPLRYGNASGAGD